MTNDAINSQSVNLLAASEPCKQTETLINMTDWCFRSLANRITCPWSHLPLAFQLGLASNAACLSNIKVLPWLPCVKLILLQRDFNPYDPFALLIPFLTPA